MEFKLPKRTEDLRIKHYSVLKNEAYQREMDLKLMIDFLSDFTGYHVNELREADLKVIHDMYAHCVNIISEYKPQDPPKQIKVDGVKYKLIDPYKVSSGWHIDFSQTDVKRDFVRLACLFYYPDGGKYGDIDENKNIIHPISERYEIFRKEFPLSVFLDSSAFFLSKYKRSIDAYTVNLKLKMRLKKLVSRMTGRG